MNDTKLFSKPIQTTVNRRRIVLTLCVLISLMLLLEYMAYTAMKPPPETLLYSACLLSTLLFAVQIWSWIYLTRSIFDPYVIFSGAAIVFNGSHETLELFDLNKHSLLGLGLSTEGALETIFAVTVALWCFHIGACLAVPVEQRVYSAPYPSLPHYESYLRMVGWALVIVALGPTMSLFIEAIRIVISVGYFGLFQQQAATSVGAAPALIAALLLPGAFLLAIGSRDRLIQRSIAAALIGMYSIVNMYLGARSVALVALVPFVWMWHRCVRPIPKLFVTVGGVLVVLIIPLVGATRTLAGSERLSPTTLIQHYGSINNPLVAAVSEMGDTEETVGHTIELVPDVHPYDLGQSYFYAGLTVIPNLFWSIHPTVARGTPATWMAWEVDPIQASRGGGKGYSFVAETYFNGGWFGIVLINTLLGYGFVRLTVWACRSTDILKMAVLTLVVTFSLKSVRADATETIRSVVWYVVIPYHFLRLLMGRLGIFGHKKLRFNRA